MNPWDALSCPPRRSSLPLLVAHLPAAREDPGRGRPVDVRPGGERIEQAPITGEVRHDPKFDPGVVRRKCHFCEAGSDDRR